MPLGYIPQVAHTYAYIDANYGIMNEHQVAIGECTDKAKVHPMPEAGKRIFYSSELSRVALERSKTAREAVLFHHPYYSLRRVWRAQSLVAPSRHLPAWVDGPFTREYPFAVSPDHKPRASLHHL